MRAGWTLRALDVLVVSGDLAVRATICEIVASLGAAPVPVPGVAEATALARQARRALLILLDGRSTRISLDAFCGMIEEVCEPPGPQIAAIRGPGERAGFGVELREAVARVLAEAVADAALPNDQVAGEDDAADAAEADLPTLDGKVVWEEIAVEQLAEGDLVSWTAIAGEAPTVVRARSVRPCALGTMPGWVIEGSRGLSWLPAGARLRRPRG